MNDVDPSAETTDGLKARVRELETEKSALESLVADLGELPESALAIRIRNKKFETVGAEVLRWIILIGGHGVALWALSNGDAALVYGALIGAWFMRDSQPARVRGAKEAAQNVQYRYRQLLEQYGLSSRNSGCIA